MILFILFCLTAIMVGVAEDFNQILELILTGASEAEWNKFIDTE